MAEPGVYVLPEDFEVAPEDADDVGMPIVCVLPEGFQLTPQRWQVIVAAWRRKGAMLGKDEVLALFKSTRPLRPR